MDLIIKVFFEICSRNAASFNVAGAGVKIDRSFWASESRERLQAGWQIEQESGTELALLET